MRENDFLDGISNINPDIVEQFISIDNKIKTIFTIRLRGTLGVIIGVIAIILLFASDIVYSFFHIDGEIAIFLLLFGLLLAFISHVFYFADAFRTKNQPYSKPTKIFNDIVLLFLILGSLTMFILVFGSICSPLLLGIYHIILTLFVIFSIIYDVKKLSR